MRYMAVRTHVWFPDYADACLRRGARGLRALHWFHLRRCAGWNRLSIR